MPPKKGPVWALFTEFKDGGYKESLTGETKALTKVLCAFECPAFEYRQEHWMQVRDGRCAKRAGQVRSRTRFTSVPEGHEEEDGGAPQRHFGKNSLFTPHPRP
jgi:hypothetical protein